MVIFFFLEFKSLSIDAGIKQVNLLLFIFKAFKAWNRSFHWDGGLSASLKTDST